MKRRRRKNFVVVAVESLREIVRYVLVWAAARVASVAYGGKKYDVATARVAAFAVLRLQDGQCGFGIVEAQNYRKGLRDSCIDST